MCDEDREIDYILTANDVPRRPGSKLLFSVFSWEASFLM